MTHRITKNFSDKEFVCRCGMACVLSEHSRISEDFVRKLQSVRDVVGPMRINSGSRCVVHNRRIGGSLNSRHLAIYSGKSMAADIQCTSSRMRYALVKEAVRLGLTIGVHPKFVHLDSRESPILFLY